MKLKSISLVAIAALWGSLLIPSARSQSKTQSETSAIYPKTPNVLISQHTDLLPRGRHHFYERDLDAMVFYVRDGNDMYGALYDRSSLVCFTANIYRESVDVRWWGDLWKLGYSGRTPISRRYTIEDFTAGNSYVETGLHVKVR
ncbi:MAG: hypothetical protein J7642_13115 [Cyanobacteria bacterium SBC]|nr:hypothetical protein [Cyanobacteria bacterium SBC]